MEEVFIYSLNNPLTREPRYIGKTTNLIRRLNSHLEEARKTKSKMTKKISWIKSLLRQGLKPEIEIVARVLRKEWGFWEEHYIGLYKSWGFNLVNGTKGGDGNMYWQKKHTEETKRKISLAHKGRPKSEIHKQNLKKALQGNKNAKGQKGSIRVKSKVYQVNTNREVEKIWTNAKEAHIKFFKKPIKTVSYLHMICRTRGKNSFS